MGIEQEQEHDEDCGCGHDHCAVQQVDRYVALAPGQWANDQGPQDFHAIFDLEEGGVIAYAGNPALAAFITSAMNVMKDLKDVT